MRSLFSAKNIPLVATTAVCLILYLTGAVLFQGFSSLRVFINFFVDNSFLGIIAIGMTLVIISGGIDLSVGSVMALCSIVMAVLMGKHNVSPALAIAVALAIGSTLGLLMGSIVHFTKLEPFIVTLAGMFLARGLALIVHIESLPIQNSFYTWVTSAGLQIGSVQVPIPAVIFLIVLALGIYVSAFTRFGRNVYAVGGNEDAALLMGLPMGRTKILVYTLSGFCAALAGVVFTIYQSSGNPTAGVGMELDAIAIVVIGGTLLTGGAGHVFGTLIGTLIFGIIQTGIAFQGNLSSWWTESCHRSPPARLHRSPEDPQPHSLQKSLTPPPVP